MSDKGFENLVNEHGRQVLNTALRVLGDANLANDVHQEVFLAIWRRWPSYNGHTHWPAYLYRVTVRKALQTARRANGHRRANPPESDRDDRRPDGDMRADELRQKLAGALAKLPADYTPLGAGLQADATAMAEADLIAFLRLWSTWTVDHVFPPTVSGPELGKITMQMVAEGKFVGPVAPGYEGDQQYQIMFRGMAFMGGLPIDIWRYAGQSVTFGDPQTPIFWYRPKDVQTYRVIYADLSIKVVASEDVPN